MNVKAVAHKRNNQVQKQFKIIQFAHLTLSHMHASDSVYERV